MALANSAEEPAAAGNPSLANGTSSPAAAGGKGSSSSESRKPTANGTAGGGNAASAAPTAPKQQQKVKPPLADGTAQQSASVDGATRLTKVNNQVCRAQGRRFSEKQCQLLHVSFMYVLLIFGTAASVSNGHVSQPSQIMANLHS